MTSKSKTNLPALIAEALGDLGPAQTVEAALRGMLAVHPEINPGRITAMPELQSFFAELSYLRGTAPDELAAFCTTGTCPAIERRRAEQERRERARREQKEREAKEKAAEAKRQEALRREAEEQVRRDRAAKEEAERKHWASERARHEAENKALAEQSARDRAAAEKAEAVKEARRRLEMGK